MTEPERQEKKEKFVSYFKEVPVQKYAAMYIGVTEQTIINWLKDDDEFFNRTQEARADWVKRKANKVRAEFALERLEKEIWSERKEQVLKLEDPLKNILTKFGIDEGEEDVGETEDTSGSSPEERP